MSFTFLHAADLHLDSPLRDVSSFPPHVGTVLREASLNAWDSLVDEASMRGVSFVLLAGDIYDGAERGLRAQRHFLEGLRRLDDEGIRTLIVHGNHDPLAHGWSAIRSFPDLVTVFPAGSVATESFAVEGERVFVHGISYESSHTSENLALRFPTATTNGFHIALLHANVGGGSTGHEDYSPCSLDDLRRPGYQYWALGHVHARRIVNERYPTVVYPGNLQGRSLKPTEQGAKGAVVVDVSGGVVGSPQFVALDKVRFCEVSISISGIEDVNDLLEGLASRASPTLFEGRSLVVRATISGSGGLHHELQQRGKQAEVLEELRRMGSSSDPFVWWQSLNWQTGPAMSSGNERSFGVTHRDFADTLQRLAAATETEARNAWRDALHASLMSSATILIDPQEDEFIWAEAQSLALSLLGNEGR